MPFNPLTDITWQEVHWAADPSWTPPSDGAAVSSWRDNATGAHHATQAAGAAQPIYRAASSVLGGQPAVEFDGSDDRLINAVGAYTQAQPFTVVYVINGWNTGGTQPCIFGATGLSVRITRGYPLTNQVAIYAGGGDFNTGGPIGDTGSHLYTFVFNGASSTITQDSTLYAATSNPGTTGITSGPVLMAYGNEGTPNATGTVAFIGVYNGDLTANTNYAAFKAWAKATYGLSAISDTSFVQAITPAASGNSASTTTTIAFTGTTKPVAGDLIVAYCARDDAASEAATPTGDSFADTNGNTWTKVVGGSGHTDATGANGLVGAMFYSILTTGWTAGTNTLTWTHPSVTGRTMQAEHWQGISGLRASGTTVGTSTAGAPSAATTVPLTGDLVLGMAAWEHATSSTITGDADTTNGSWSTNVTASGGSTNLTGVKVTRQYKFVTGAGTQTYNPTNSTTASVDAVAIVAAFVPTAPTSNASVNLTAISTTTSLPASTKTAAVTLAPVGTVAALPASTRTASGNVTAAAIATAAAIPAPTKTVTALPSTIATAAAMPAPTKTATGNAVPWSGVGIVTADYNDLATIDVAWWYDWDHLGGSKNPPNSPLYVPMVWGDPAVTGQGGGSVATIGAGATTLLGFNEPDGPNPTGSNVTVARALALWPDLMATGARLGSPAVSAAAGGPTWLSSFMAGVASNGYRVDFICAHWYGNNVATLVSFLDNLFTTYGRPIWLTEFDYVGGTTADNATFAAAALAALDDLAYVERVAWFTNRDFPSLTGYEHVGLVDSGGSLTSTGTNYAAVGNAIDRDGLTFAHADWTPNALTGWSKVAGLTELFADATMLERTFAYTGHVDLNAGRLRLESRADFGGFAESTAMWDLTSSSVGFSVGTLSTTTTDMMLAMLRQNRSQNNRIEVGQTGTTLWLKGVNGGTDVGYTSTTFNATNHAWWRLRDNGTSVFLDTSTDGATWSTATLALARSALTWTPDAVELLFNVGFTGTESTPRYLYVDNVNAAGSAPAATAITTVVTMPAPTLTVTALPATVATAATMPTPTKTVGATPSTITTVAALPASTRTASGNVAATVVATSATMPAPTRSTTTTLPVVATVAALPSSTKTASGNVTAAAIVTVAAVPSISPTTVGPGGLTLTPISTAAAIAVRSEELLDQNGDPILDQNGNPITTPGFVVSVPAGVTVTAIVTVTALPASTKTATASIAPTTVATTATLPSSAKSASLAASPVATTTTMPAPAETASAGPTVTAIVTTTTLPASTKTATGNVTPSTVATTTAMPATVETAAANVAPASVATATTMPTPARSATLTPASVQTTTTLPAPAIASGSGASITTTTIVTTTTIATPALSATGNVTLIAVTTTTTTPAPTKTASVSIAATPIPTTTTLQGPGLRADAAITATPIPTVTTLPAPGVSAGSSSSITTTTIATVTTLPAPGERVDVQRTATVIATTTTTPSPNVATGSSANVTTTSIATTANIPPAAIAAAIRAATISTAAAIPAVLVHVVGLIYSLLGDVIGDVLTLDIEGDVDDLAAILAAADELSIEGSVQS